ncbi:hypothetical protein K8O68_15315 [Salipaludibacillus sp. CUR1]|uniref:hypothetical protein n=1 Tax=Salipaludibacillus sp. CUR1 TaxID=2820003 RepID=UPI001E3DD62C|nr:hypothetical protein [Salipaludibacillus sp. CUR1]MCE7793792.1 hypothetical protein [Salipaludibacillus sp. CUR1]
MKKKTVVFLLVGMIVLISVLGFGTLKASGINGFPIPVNAKAEEIHSDESISYSFPGINRIYLQQLKLRGWKEVDQMGSLITFEKNGVKVDIITFQGGFQISSHNGN